MAESEPRPLLRVQGAKVALAKVSAASRKVRVQPHFVSLTSQLKMGRGKRAGHWRAVVFSQMHIDDGTGDWSGGGSINDHENELTGAMESDLYDNTGLDGTIPEDDPGNHGFHDSREGIFHYCIIGHNIAGTETRGHGDSPGDEFALAGARIYGTDAWRHVFMHELGHNLIGTMNSDHRSSYDDDHCNQETCVMFEGTTWYSLGQSIRSWDSDWNFCSDCWADIDPAKSI